MRGIAVLGCTGSIGDTALKVLDGLADQYRVVGLAGGKQLGKLVERARRWQPQIVCVGRAEDVDQARSALPRTDIVCGEQGLLEVVEHAGVEIVLNGLVGSVGLVPTVRALRAGRTVAMANKEPLVMAGGLVLEAAAAGHARLLPLDSEPNAIWQCLQGQDREGIGRLVLTASGGPFFGRAPHELVGVRPEEALAHPTWRMGAKITVDSATLMNKGFEVIEASWLFGVPTDRIEVLVHRESVVHSMVEFRDGSILAHLGRTDMALPIQYALTHPGRRPAPVAPLDLATLGRLTFAPPDRAGFPCLDLCYEAARRGGVAPVALNAADEVAVAAFLAGRLGFLGIHQVAAAVMDAAPAGTVTDLDDVLAADAWARQAAAERIARAS